MSNGRYERELINNLRDQSYAVMRAPSSGGGTDRDLPDVLWSREGEDTRACELKTTSEPYAYYDEREVQALERFANAFNAIPLLVARYKGDTEYYACHPTNAGRTDGGNYVLHRDNVGEYLHLTTNE